MFLDKYKMKIRNFGKENKLLLFDILDYIVDQGNLNIWKSVSSKKFFTFILDILKTQNDAEIQTKLLQIIQNWGNGFQNKKDVVPNFFKIYNKFQMNGVVFPPKEQPNYYNYISKINTNPINYKHEEIEEPKEVKEDNDEDNNEFEENTNNFEYIESIKNKLKVSNFESKYRRLVTFLVNMHNNIKIANVLIDRRDFAKLKDSINTIKKGNKTLIDTISSGRLKDEKLMEITLATTEDISQTLSREEEIKKGNRPNNFTSSFVINEIIPIGNKSRIRAKSERKKGTLNKRNNLEKTNKNENNLANTNIKNVDDIFDLFSNINLNSNTNVSNNNNNNQNNNIISNYFTNQNSNNKFYNINQIDERPNFNKNEFDNYNNGNKNNRENNQNPNMNFNNTNINNNFNINNPKNKMIDLFQDNQNVNQQNINNFQNKNYNSDEFDKYGPAPEINSNELVNYLGGFNNQNNNFNNMNNQFSNFNNNPNNNNNDFGNNQNNYGNNMSNYNENNQMTQEEIEREQRLKELDELF